MVFYSSLLIQFHMDNIHHSFKPIIFVVCDTILFILARVVGCLQVLDLLAQVVAKFISAF